ncbi:MAG: hypothetical protein ACRC1Z_07550 [Waterburya sp.]
MAIGANNSGDRLDRIENALDRLVGGLEETKANIDRLNVGLEETKAIANSNSRAIQAMMKQQATDRLNREEEKAENERRIRLLEETQRDLVRTSAGVVRLLTAMDEDRPTILRRLMTIENKVDLILEREQQ